MRVAVLPALVSLWLLACGSSSPEDDHTLPGVWTGNYGGTSGTPSTPYQFAFLADGQIRVRANSGFLATASGTWTETAGTVNATYTYDTGGEYSIAATRSGGTLTGTWGAGTSSSGGGNFTMTDSDGGAVGVWTGTYGFGAATTPAGYRFLVFPDGTLEAYDGLDFSSRAAGTWSVAGSAFTADYLYDGSSSNISIAGTLGASTLGGTWTNDDSPTLTGGFALTRD